MGLYDIAGKNIDTLDKMPNVVFMGDSITDQDDHGAWVKLLLNYVSFQSLTSYACGYARWTVAADTTENLDVHSHTAAPWNVIWNQFNRLKNDVNNGIVTRAEHDVIVGDGTITTPDVIVIFAGINDVNLGSTIGDVETAFDGNPILTKSFSEIANLAQSIRYTCECIINEFPTTQVILATPNQRAGHSYYAKTAEVRDTIIDCARHMSLAVINQTDESGFYGYGESQNPVNTRLNDGLHPSETGHERLAKYVSRKMMNIVNERR